MAAIECETCDSAGPHVLYDLHAAEWRCPACTVQCDACDAIDYVIALGPVTYTV